METCLNEIAYSWITSIKFILYLHEIVLEWKILRMGKDNPQRDNVPAG